MTVFRRRDSHTQNSLHKLTITLTNVYDIETTRSYSSHNVLLNHTFRCVGQSAEFEYSNERTNEPDSHLQASSEFLERFLSHMIVGKVDCSICVAQSITT